jgi:hypothetical protein
MTETPQARPVLLTINAVLSILFGAAGTLLLFYGFLFDVIGAAGTLLLGENVLPEIFPPTYADPFTFLLLISVVGGHVLIALTALRWGLAVISGQPTMAYFPGRAARVGRYGRATGILTLVAAIPFGFFLTFLLGQYDDPIITLFALVYLVVVATAVGMIAFASRIDRGSKA